MFRSHGSQKKRCHGPRMRATQVTPAPRVATGSAAFAADDSEWVAGIPAKMMATMFMNRTAFAFLLLIVLPPFPAHAADSALTIDARRLTVMMSQARDIEVSFGLSPAPDASSVSLGPYDDLVIAVRSYTLLAPVACAARKIDAKLCKGTFRPRWLDGEATGLTDTQLRAMTDETAARLIPFWSALCAKAPRPENGEPVCPME